jgi:hypothetical protein
LDIFMGHGGHWLATFSRAPVTKRPHDPQIASTSIARSASQRYFVVGHHHGSNKLTECSITDDLLG